MVLDTLACPRFSQALQDLEEPGELGRIIRLKLTEGSYTFLCRDLVLISMVQGRRFLRKPLAAGPCGVKAARSLLASSR
jgi:hypothetical protein